MEKLTSAYANKLLKKLNEDKEYWLDKECTSYNYTAAVDEEPVIPEYDYLSVANTIEEIDTKICKIKHAINLTNATVKLDIGSSKLSVDTILVKMAQLNKRKQRLDVMRKQQPILRISSNYYSSKKSVAEYQYINYDLNLIKSEYERIDAEIAAMQIALDKHNQTYEFEVEI